MIALLVDRKALDSQLGRVFLLSGPFGQFAVLDPRCNATPFVDKKRVSGFPFLQGFLRVTFSADTRLFVKEELIFTSKLVVSALLLA